MIENTDGKCHNGTVYPLPDQTMFKDRHETWRDTYEEITSCYRGRRHHGEPGIAQQKYRSPWCPRPMKHRFFDVARDGCLKRARNSQRRMHLTRTDRARAGDEAADHPNFITQKVDGMAISVRRRAMTSRSKRRPPPAFRSDLRCRCAGLQASRLYRYQQQGLRLALASNCASSGPMVARCHDLGGPGPRILPNASMRS